ncbi:MAG: hypothetical protein Q6365_022210 [Candidatus Sigynarchaeota archaeon]
MTFTKLCERCMAIITWDADRRCFTDEDGWSRHRCYRDGDTFTVHCWTCDERVLLTYDGDAGRWIPGHSHCRYCGDKITWKNNIPRGMDGSRHDCRGIARRSFGLHEKQSSTLFTTGITIPRRRS